jgi:hypothetical protein
MLLYIGTFALVVLSAQVEASSHLRYKEAEEVIPERLLVRCVRKILCLHLQFSESS